MIQSLCLLGSFRVCPDSLIKVPKKGQALLTLLAVAALDGEGMSRQRLSRTLWPYQDQEHARHSLRRCLSELREALPADIVKLLITDFTDCRLDMRTDVADFARLEKSDNQRDLEAAADLYRGDLLDDLWITSEPFREWLESEREMWRQRAVAVLIRLSATATANADHSTAIGAARRVTHIEPWNEDGHRLLIAALDASGQRGEAKRQYRICRRALQRELGIEPDPETEELAARLFAVNPIMETVRRDRKVMTKVLVRLEYHIDARHVGMKSLEAMRDVIKARLGDEYLAPAPRPRPQSNGEAGVELRA